MPFLKNAWYAAAWSHEVSRTLLKRVIMEDAILFYRKEDGTAVAMSNRCAHRFAPLHLGKLDIGIVNVRRRMDELLKAESATN
jgi:vanillate O-demethylase monooxygenase subunit